MKKIIGLLLVMMMALSACGTNSEIATQENEVEVESIEAIETSEETQDVPIETPIETAPYRRIEAEVAKENLADETQDILLLDVRTQEEYDAGHIADAIVFPLDKIAADIESNYPDKEQVIYVYCRSGRRSEASAAILLDLGYQNVYDLGGIINWPYDIVE